MLSIRLSRRGKKKEPFYRIVVMDKARDPWADYLEKLGHYNPRTKELVLKEDRVKHWLSVGAQPSDTIHNMLISQGILTGSKKNVSSLGKKFKEKMTKKEDGQESGQQPTVNGQQGSQQEKEKPAEPVKAEEAKPEKPETKEPKTEELKPEEPRAEEKSEEAKPEVEALKEEPKAEENPAS